MERKINLAWALRVNHYQILARLEAYIETRVPITVLRVCIARTTSPSLPKLPSEIVAIITSALQDLEYKSKLPEFLKLQMCLEGRCLPDAHFSQAMFGDAYSPSPDAEGEGESVKRVPGWVKVKEYLKRKCAPPGSSTWGQLDDSEDLEAGRRIIQAWDKKENEEIHQRVVSEHLRGIKYNVGYMTLYRKIFFIEFGIHPFSTVLKHTEYDRVENGQRYAKIKTAEVLSYLAMPIVKARVKSE